MTIRVITLLFLLAGLTACSHFSSPQTADIKAPQAEQSLTPLDIAAPQDDTGSEAPKAQLAEEEEAAPGDLWQRVRDGFELSYTDNNRIKTHRDWYASHSTYMARVTERANHYLYGIVEKLDERGLPHELALLPIVESAFDPFAYSHGRASGLWQFIPSTGRHYGLDRNYWYDGRRDIEASTNAALDYLTALNARFDGDWLLALAAYNTGEGNLGRAIRRNKRAGKPTDFWSLNLPRETRAYVPQLLALTDIVRSPEKYNVALTPIEDQPFYQVVDVDSQIDLAKAAELADLEIEEFYRLNPAFNQWATDPSGPHELLVPVAKVETFKKNLALYPPEKRLTWDTYSVKKGDSLLSIAKRYNTTPGVIQKTNNISGTLIRVGQDLLIPKAAANSDHYAFSAAERTERVQNNSRGKAGTKKVAYTVRSGDSFWKISRRYNVGVKQLAKWNNMAPGDPLQVGQKLVVWTASANAVAQAPQKASHLVRKVAYKVRSGDSLYRIANKFSLSVSDILSWNSLNKNNYLQPGQRLTLWVDLTQAK